METDEAKLPPAARAALDALRRCSLTELGAIELYHFRRVKQEVAKRTAEACRARVAAEEAWDMDDRVAQSDPVAPVIVSDGTVGETDEDGDEVLDPTPVEPIEPRVVE